MAETVVPTDVVTYGPAVGTEEDFRLLGDVKGKRVLELGCGRAQRSIAFARQGATAIGVDFSREMIDAAMRLCGREGVKVELRRSDLADLAFLRGDSVDLVFSVYALSYERDVERVFRQAHRVLRAGAPLVFSIVHPVAEVVGPADPDQPLGLTRSYFDRSGVASDRDGESVTAYHHTLSDLLVGLVRAGYRIDTVLEPEPLDARLQAPQQGPASLPRTLIVRARKERL